MDYDAQSTHDDPEHPAESRTTATLAEDLEVGHVIELETQHGCKTIRVSRIERRVRGMKIVGVTADGAEWAFGAVYGSAITRLL